ncbi:MAG: glycosyltransferase family 2 protein [Thermoleophilaceae bacterium]
MSLPSVSVVLPAYNEEANVAQAIAESTAAVDHLFGEHEVLVIDDGSSDRTSEVVRDIASENPRVRLISHDRNRGYGEALRTGFLASRLDYVFFTDADLQFDVAELERFMPFLGAVDVVAGYRINRQDKLQRRLNGYAWNILVRALFYVPVRDIDCAFKLFDRRVLTAIDIESVGAMVNTELMVKLGRRGSSVVEVGVTHRPRLAGDARGASPRVIATAFREVAAMRRRLSVLDGREL